MRPNKINVVFLVRLCIFGYFGKPDTRNWKFGVNNFVKTHNTNKNILTYYWVVGDTGNTTFFVFGLITFPLAKLTYEYM